MEHRATTKSIREYYGKNIISIGYCGAQNLLSYQSRNCYTCGIYGWNFDVYEVDGVAICTGYRSMPNGMSYDYKRLEFFENKAESIRRNPKIPYEQQVAMVNELLRDFIGEVKNANKSKQV